MTEEVIDMKTVFADPDEPTLVMVQVYPPNAGINNVANTLRTYPGVGQPFYAFATIPRAVETNPAADFADAPVVSNSVAENEAAITAMLNDAELQALPNDKVFTAS